MSFIFTSICKRKSSPSSAAVKNHRQSRNNVVSNSEPTTPHLRMMNLPAAHHQQAVLPSPMITLPSQPTQQSAKLDSSPIVALLDTGSALTIVSDTVARRLNAQLSQSTTNGSIMKLLGRFTPNLTIGQKTMQITCYVASDANCSSPFILGNDVIQQFAQTVSINYHSNTVSFDKIIVPFTITTITSPLFQFT
ncbi:hypothetical protein COOONC_17361 [Cooperia oncophora]